MEHSDETVTAAESTAPAETSPMSDDGAEHEGGDDGAEETSSEGEAQASADGTAPKKRRRRRRKKKTGEGATEGGEAAAAGEEGAKPSEPKKADAKREKRKEHPLPFSRFFSDGAPRKHPFSSGEIVGGIVVRVEHGVAVVDLFGKGIAFASDHEPREIPVLAEAVAPEEAKAEAAGEESKVEAAGDEAKVEDAPAEETEAKAEAETHETSAGQEEAPAEDDTSRPALEVGQVFRARIASVSESGHIALANRVTIRAESRQKLARSREQHQRVWGLVYGFNRGGFDVLVEGIRSFCPISGMTIETFDDPRDLLGRRLEFSVQAAKSGHQGIVVSRRSLLEREARRRAKELRRSLEPGRRLRGRVTHVRDFGIFVDIGGIEGLVHMSEVSWDRSVKPSDVARPGDEIDVQVLRVGGDDRRGEGRDRRDGRVGLSIKALLPDPWTQHAAELEEGQVKKGKVNRTAEFGAFVEIAPGIEGLLHVSELGRDLKHANERVKDGEEIYVVVERIDARAKRVSLSRLSEQGIKAFEEGQLAGEGAKAIRPGQSVKVKVERVEPVGIFVQVEGVIGKRGRGFISNSEAGTERGTDHRKKFPVGTELDVKVVGLDRDGGLRLSRKGFYQDEERRAVQSYRREAATKGFGTFGDLLRSKLEKT